MNASLVFSFSDRPLTVRAVVDDHDRELANRRVRIEVGGATVFVEHGAVPDLVGQLWRAYEQAALGSPLAEAVA